MSFLFGGKPKVAMPQATAALTIQQSSYGTPVTLCYGTNRVYGNLIWYGDFQADLVSTGGGGGGKGGVVGGGGKGGGSSQYQYYASFAVGLCEGPINYVNQVYVSKQITSLPGLNGSQFIGTVGQAPWGYLSSVHPDQALGYTELAYVGFPNFSLGTSSETPQFSFEVVGLLAGTVVGALQDTSPDLFIIDFLTRAGFPTQYIGAFTELATYCRANNFFVSPLIDQQKTARDWLSEIMTTLNCEFVWSDGVLDAKSYGDTTVSNNGVTYTPDLSPQYTITLDNLLRDSDNEDPIKVTRKDLEDVNNQFPIEYLNRSDQYNIETWTAFDDALTDQYGIRVASTVRAHHITDPGVAHNMQNIYMYRQIYIRNTFEFKLPWNYIRLDPMDLIAIPDPSDLNNNILVRIVSIEEDEGNDQSLSFTCEEVPGVIAGPAVFPDFGTERHLPNYNLDPGSVNMPVIFEAPLALVQSASVEIDIALSGANEIWGGCDVWVSTDDITYTYVAQVSGQSRMGTITADLPTFTVTSGSNSIDTINTLSVDMTESRGVFNSAATPQDAVQFNTLCYVDGELIAFGNDVLTGTNKYDLTYLRRGSYGSTIADHQPGTMFARIDQSIFRYPVDQSRVGQTLYFKFASFNVWGGGVQSLDEITPYPYNVTGAALLTPLDNPSNLSVSYVDNIARLSWTGVNDIRYPILYQIRKGTDFPSAQIIGTTTTTDFLVYGTDTYWVTALYFTPFNVAVYSGTPVSIAVATPALPQYIIDHEDEQPLWTGTLGGGAVLSGSTIEIELAGGNILDEVNVLNIPNVLNYSGVTNSGSYTIPVGHRIFTNSICNAKVIIDWTLSAVNVLSDVVTNPDITTTSDITGEVSSALVAAVPQVRVSQDGGSTWGDWQNWVPGVYPGNGWDFQILMFTLDTSVNAILSVFGYTVDVPLAAQTGTATTSASVTTNITYTDEFNIVPYITITINNAQNGDYYVLGTVTSSGFPVDVYNGASRVVRSITYTATGY